MRSFRRYSSPNIIKIIKGRMRWMGHVECMRQIRNGMYKPLVLYWNHIYSHVLSTYMLVQELLFLIYTSVVLWLVFLLWQVSTAKSILVHDLFLVHCYVLPHLDFSWRLQFFVCCLSSLGIDSVLHSCNPIQEYTCIIYALRRKMEYTKSDNTTLHQEEWGVSTNLDTTVLTGSSNYANKNMKY